jgi:hypothetical protein
VGDANDALDGVIEGVGREGIGDLDDLEGIDVEVGAEGFGKDGLGLVEGADGAPDWWVLARWTMGRSNE